MKNSHEYLWTPESNKIERLSVKKEVKCKPKYFVSNIFSKEIENARSPEINKVERISVKKS